MEEYTRHSAHAPDEYIEREGCCALWDAMAPCKVRIGGWRGLRFRRTRGDGGYGAFAVWRYTDAHPHAPPQIYVCS